MFVGDWRTAVEAACEQGAANELPPEPYMWYVSPARPPYACQAEQRPLTIILRIE